jgi:hypothetical protein
METDPWSGLGDYAYLAALLIPIVCGLLTKASWPSWAKFLVVIALSAAVGAITIWQTSGSWEWSAPFVLSIIGASQIVYRTLKALVPGILDWAQGSLVKDSPAGS